MKRTIEKNIPQCVGIIMDGNRRWARARGKGTIAGHKAGFEKLKETVRWGEEAGVKYLIVFVFSTENWKRTKEEVGYLLGLFETALIKEFKKFKDVRFRFIGNRAQFSTKLQKLMQKVETESADRNGVTLVPAVSYGGREEILHAAKVISRLNLDKVTEKDFADALYTKDIPDPDLIIRTSGKTRLSGFLPWQTVYSELFFTKTLWPDFSKKEFEDILAEYASRERRMGK